MQPDVDRIRAMLAEGHRQVDIARMLGISQSAVSRAAGDLSEEIGPVQEAVGALVADLGPLTAEVAARAAIASTLAERLDATGRGRTGASGFAAASLGRELGRLLDELRPREHRPDALDDLLARRRARRARVRAEGNGGAAA